MSARWVTLDGDELLACCVCSHGCCKVELVIYSSRSVGQTGQRSLQLAGFGLQGA